MADAPKPANQQASAEQPKAVPVEAPLYYASNMALFRAGNDFILTFTRQRHVLVQGLKEGQSAAMQVPVASFNISPGTLKDLAIATQQQVDLYEKEFGKIDTEYTRLTAAQAAKK